MFRRGLVLAASRSKSLLDSVHVFRPEFAQGKFRIDLDQPAKQNKLQQQIYTLTDDEREMYEDEPYIGVDHAVASHLFGRKFSLFINSPENCFPLFLTSPRFFLAVVWY